MSDVSTISSAMLADRLQPRALVADAFVADRSGASGCGRRVSLKRRTSAALLASRKISTGLSRGIFRSRSKILGNDDRKLPLADVDDDGDLLDVAAARSDSFASVGISVVGRLSTQKYPRSSSARIACDFPSPTSPVRTMNGWPPFGLRGPAPRASLRPLHRRLPVLSAPLGRPRRPRRGRRASSARSACSRRSASARAAWWPRDPQQLIARRDLDQDRDVAAGRHRHPDQRHAQAEDLVDSRRRGRGARTRAPDPSARAARRARRASTTASRRCRTGP